MTRDEFDQMLKAHGIVFVGDAAWRVAQLVAAAERESCAKVCDHMASRCSDIRSAALEMAAENIRARGRA